MSPGALRSDWRFTVGVVSGGHFLSHFYILTFPPLFPLLRAEFGLSNTELGLLVSMIAAAGLLQAPVGDLVDRIGAKWVFVTGVALTSVGVALVGLAPTYLAMLGIALLAGVGQSAFHPADYALIDTVTDASVQGRGFSLHTFSGFAGFAAAPVVVGTLALSHGWRVTLAVVGAAGLVYAVFAAVVLSPVYLRREAEEGGTPRDAVAADGTTADTAEGDGDAPAAGGDRDSFRSALLRPGILAMFAFFVASALAGKGLQTFTTVLAVESFDLAEAVGNTALTTYFVMAAGGVLVGGFLADRYPPHRVIGGGLGLGASLLLLVVTGVLPTDATSLVGAYGAMGFAIGLVFPSRDRLVAALSTAGSTGRSFGVVFTGLTVGGLVGPTLLGAVSDVVSITVAFVLVGAFYLAAAGIALTLGRARPSVAPAASTVEGD